MDILATNSRVWLSKSFRFGVEVGIKTFLYT